MFGCQIGQFKLFIKLFVLNTRIGKALVIRQKLFPGGGHVFVGGKGRDKGAEAEIADNHQIAANRIEEERRDLGDEVIEEFDKELTEIDFLTDFKNPAQTLGEVGKFEPLGFVGANVGRTPNGLADMFGHPAHVLHALFAQHIDAFLQFRDQISL